MLKIMFNWKKHVKNSTINVAPELSGANIVFHIILKIENGYVIKFNILKVYFISINYFINIIYYYKNIEKIKCWFNLNK